MITELYAEHIALERQSAASLTDDENTIIVNKQIGIEERISQYLPRNLEEVLSILEITHGRTKIDDDISADLIASAMRGLRN